jgi:hypothetical protein
MAQREAGEYVADVPVAEPGHYLVTLTFERDGRTFAGRGTGAVDYASEHRFLSSNPDALQRAAGIAGGRALAAMDDPFRQDITGAQGRRELWPTFLALAVGLLVMEIGARRLDVPWSRLLPRMSWRLLRRASSPPVAAQEPARKTERPQPTPSRAGVWEEEPLSREPPKAPPVPKAPSEGTMERLRKAQEKAQRKRKWQ